MGDSRRMKEVKDESVHLIITSPPYWQLKDYGLKEQIGFNDSYEDYINNLNLVWNECFYGHWLFSGERQNKHIAPFPEELSRRLIKMFSFVGDAVPDPFLGSGTTSVVSLKLSRNSIGYEINEDYLSNITNRLMENIGIFEQNDQVEIIKQEREDIDFSEKIQSLPYIFKNPITFERKVNPKLLRFGSSIDGKEKDKKKYYIVKKVISPSELLLNSGTRIDLIGIKPDGRNDIEVIQFLEKLTRGHKVFLKTDDMKDDKNNNMPCYLYLKNKTFVNAHLIKTGLVELDTTVDYKMKDKFINLLVRSGREDS